MKFWLLLFCLFSAQSIASTYLYLSADALSSNSGYSLQYGFSFPADDEQLYFGYELDYTSYSNEFSSYGINIKPTFRQHRFFFTPIAGIHNVTNDIDVGFIYGAEAGYDFKQFSIKAGYKETSKEFKDNRNVFLGIAFKF